MRPFLLVLLFAALAAARPAAAANQEKDFKQYLDSLVGRKYWLRPMVNSSPKVYCETDVAETCFIHETGALYQFPQRIVVAVTRVKYDRDENQVFMSFEHRKMGRGAITFCWPEQATPSAQSLEQMMRYVFSQPGRKDDFKPYVGNRLSEFLHYAGCNHLPPEQYREQFATVEEAERLHYVKCGLCFTDLKRIPEYELEIYMGRKAVGNLLNQSIVSSNQRMRRLVQAVGQRVLENWPYTLRGYDYSFNVLVSRDMNACACPGGWVFVNTGLLEAIESENELEAVLAHEIAHVERRHGLRDLRRGKKVAFWSSLIAEIAGNIFSAKTGATGGALEFYKGIYEVAAQAAKIAMMGYSRESEMEADIYAINYMKKVRNDLISHNYFERKAQYQANLMGQVKDSKASPFSTHPDSDFRVQFADNAKIEDFGSGIEFKGYDKHGELVAVLVLESQCVSLGVVEGEEDKTALSSYYDAGKAVGEELVKKLYLFGTIRTTKAMTDTCEMKSIKVKCGEKTVKLDNKEDTILIPLYETGCAFERNTDQLLECIDAIELKLPDVKQWRKEE